MITQRDLKQKMYYVSIIFFLLGTASCQKSPSSEKEIPSTEIKKYSAPEAKTIIQGKAKEVLLALKTQDFPKLASYVHPRKGVLFSPYATIGESPHLVFSQNNLSHIQHSEPIKYVWGVSDGEGESIQLTVKEYFQDYVFSRDFTLDKSPTYNQHNQPGTSINNVFEIYPEAIVVDYFDPGPPETDGMGWRYLRLVFEKENEEWFLVAVVNDQWTT